MNSSKIEVSIICNTYNHESYIREALESFLMQKTSFAYEVLIHDDASTDHTADIIKEYEKKYPDVIKPIYQSVNQYSQGNSIRQSSRARGTYIAMCEGDDYWTDPLKLQKQFDAMEKHPEVDICAHASSGIRADTGRILKRIAPRNEDCIISTEDVIAGGGRFVATNSLFYRKEMDANIPEFRACFPLDYFLQIHGSLRGGMLYLSDNMSVYRMNAKGSWSKRIKGDGDMFGAHREKAARSLLMLDEETNYQYHEVIESHLLQNRFKECVRQKRFDELKTNEELKHYYDELPMKSKMKVSLRKVQWKLNK